MTATQQQNAAQAKVNDFFSAHSAQVTANLMNAFEARPQRVAAATEVAALFQKHWNLSLASLVVKQAVRAIPTAISVIATQAAKEPGKEPNKLSLLPISTIAFRINQPKAWATSPGLFSPSRPKISHLDADGLTKLSGNTGLLEQPPSGRVDALAMLHALALLLEECENAPASVPSTVLTQRVEYLRKWGESLLEGEQETAVVTYDMCVAENGDRVTWLRPFNSWTTPIKNGTPLSVPEILNSAFEETLSRASAKALRESWASCADCVVIDSQGLYAAVPQVAKRAPYLDCLKGKEHPATAAILVSENLALLDSALAQQAASLLVQQNTSPLTVLKRTLRLVDTTQGRFPCLMGDSGIGKSQSVLAFVRELECRHASNVHFEYYGCHGGSTSADMLGSIQPIVINGEAKYMWVDGPVLRAIKAAAEGKKTVLFLDELNRIDSQETSWLIPLLTVQNGKYVAPTSEAVAVNGVTSQVVAACPAANLTVIAAMNVGAAFSVESLDRALMSRMVPIVVPYQVQTLVATMKFEMNMGPLAPAWGSVMEAIRTLAEDNTLTRRVNLRDVATTKDLADALMAQGLTALESVVAIMLSLSDFLPLDYQTGESNIEAKAALEAALSTVLANAGSTKPLDILADHVMEVLDSTEF